MNEDELESLRERLGALAVALGESSGDAALALDYAANDPAGAVAKAGRVTEAMLIKLHRHFGGPELKKNPSFQDLVEALKPSIPGNIRAHIEHVQRFRNAGAHVSRMEVQSEDLSTVLNAFVRVVEWYVGVIGTAAPKSPTSPGLKKVRRSLVLWQRFAIGGAVACAALVVVLFLNSSSEPGVAPAFIEQGAGARRVRAPPADDAACPEGQHAFRIVGEARAVAITAAAGHCTVVRGTLHCCAP